MDKMFNRYKYIQQKAKILSRLFWLEHKVEIYNNSNIIKVIISKNDKSKVLIIDMKTFTGYDYVDKNNIDTNLLHLYFSLVEEIYNEYD